MEWYVTRGDNDKNNDEENMLEHHGILGMKWGVRRYQNEDGSLTAAGKKRYSEDIKDKISDIGKKISNAASDAAFETQWAVERAADYVKDIPRKVDYAIKDSKMSESRRQAIQKYRESKEFGFDGTGKPKFGMTGETVADYAISGNAKYLFGPYHSYESLKANGCRAVDTWMACKQYLTNFYDMVYSDRNGLYDDPIPDDYMWNEILDASGTGTIDIKNADELAEYIKEHLTDQWGEELSEEAIKNIVKQYQEIAKIWNDMVEEINKQGLTELFFNSDNKALNYPLPDGSYADLQYYGESLGVKPKVVKAHIDMSKQNVGQLKVGEHGLYLIRNKKSYLKDKDNTKPELTKTKEIEPRKATMTELAKLRNAANAKPELTKTKEIEPRKATSSDLEKLRKAMNRQTKS